MKQYITFMIIFIGLISSILAADGKHLFILSGQSNMVGLKPEDSFTPVVNKALGKKNVIVVKDAQGGRPIRDWYKKWSGKKGKKSKKQGRLYYRLMEKVNEAIKNEKLSSITFVWMQGEADAKGNGEKYAEAFKGIMDQLRQDLKKQNIYFVIGRISDYGIKDQKRPDWNLIRETQVQLADDSSHGDWVDTDDLNGSKNDLHYDKKGYKALGKRFAEKAIKLIKKNSK